MTRPAKYRRRVDSGDSLLLRSPDAVLAALPYLLGFTPRESAVLLWVRRHRILLTQRVDLPSAGVEWTSWLDTVWSHQASHQADDLVVVLATSRSDAGALAEALVARADDADVPVRDVLRVADGRWWSLLCEETSCCPPQGRAIDAEIRAAVAAEFTVMGVAPMADRAALVRTLDADADLVQRRRAATEHAAAEVPEGSGDREPWREASLTLALEVLRVGSAPADADAPRLVVAMSDIRVRDTLLWECARAEATELRPALDVLSDAVRGAPDGRVAPTATVCAAVAWLLGDGARSLIAVERALNDDPHYSLALLILQSLQAGLPPETWREALAGVTREECRFGVGRRAAGSA